MAAPTLRKHPKTARCPEHGLVLVDGQACTLCKSSRSRSTSPWLIAALGGVAVAAVIAVRTLDADEPRAATTAPAPSSSATTRIERSRPSFERLPASDVTNRHRASSPSAAALPGLASAPLPEVEPTEGSEALPAEDRLLGQPAAVLEPTVDRPPPPDPPGVRGFPAPVRADDPTDFD